MTAIFISYRRRDSGGHAGRLHDRLTDRLDRADIFYDLETIQPGEAFPKRIDSALRSARLVLVLIGPDWLSEINRRATSNESDLVRHEIELALQLACEHGGPQILPVLLGGASMPGASELDPSLQAAIGPLCDLDAHSIHGKNEDWKNQFQRLLDRVTQLTGLTPQRTPHQNARLDPLRKIRDSYLKDLHASVQNIIDESIHRVRFLDLGIKDYRAAVRSPVLYKNPERQEMLNSISEAFANADGRLLVLGEPGSGKTTLLYQLALELVAQAASDAGAPVPILANLSAFPLQRAESKQPSGRKFALKAIGGTKRKSVRDWLADLVMKNLQVSERAAEELLKSNSVVFLLDGLDEVTDEYRIELAIELNKTFLSVYPYAPVVVCSRKYEYIQIQDRDDARLQLRSAAVLQPLDDDSVFSYVEAACAPALAQSLRSDGTMLEMARSPLMLSLMSLAYANKKIGDIDLTGSLTYKRHALMEEYVSQMVQRTERKRRNIPTDVPGIDVPEGEYRYGLPTVNRYLGWLAVMMSTRMKTSLAPANLYGLALSGRPDLFDQTVCAIALGVFISLVSLVSMLPGLLAGADHLPMMLGALAILVLLFAVGNSTASTKRSGALRGVAMFAWGAVTVVISLTQFAHGASLLFPWLGTPVQAGVVAAVALATMATLIFSLLDQDWPLFIGAISATAVLAGAAFMPLPRWGAGQTLFYAALAIICISIVIAQTKDENLSTGLYHGIAIPGFILLIKEKFTLIPDLAEVGSVIVLFGILTLAHLAELSRCWLIALASLATIGILVGSWAGMAFLLLGLGLPGLVLLDEFISLYRRSEAGIARLNRHARIGRWIDSATERWVLSPVIWRLTALAKRWPWRGNEFKAYCRASYILSASSEFQFAHRRLRDYFSLRLLLPVLRSEHHSNRLGAIESLAYQGDAAIETLIDIAREGPVELSMAAATALGKVASVEALAGIEELAKHHDPRVRAAMLNSLSGVAPDDALRIAAEGFDDSSVHVEATAIKAARQIGRYHGGEGRISHHLSHRAVSKDLVKALLEIQVPLDYAIKLPDWFFSACVQLLEEGNEAIASQCMKYLRDQKFPTPLEVFIPYLKKPNSKEYDKEARINVSILRAIVACDPSRSIPFILSALFSENAEIQLTALNLHFSELKLENKSTPECSALNQAAEILNRRCETGWWNRLKNLRRVRADALALAELRSRMPQGSVQL